MTSGENGSCTADVRSPSDTMILLGHLMLFVLALILLLALLGVFV